MKAKIINYEVDINYQCPNCRLAFKFRNDQIPTARKIKHECVNCWESIDIEPVVVMVEEREKRAPVKDTYPHTSLSAAKWTLVGLGYDAKEAYSLLLAALTKKSLPKNTKASVLVKLALAHESSDEYTTTRTV